MFEGILQPTHLVLILAIILIVFGPGKLPQLGKTLGQSIRELRSASADTAGASVEPTPVSAVPHVEPMQTVQAVRTEER